MKKVLITGANGFLGSNVARELYRSGYEVKLMMRSTSSAEVINDIPCEIFYGKIDDAADVHQAVAGCDFVVHTASVTQQWAIKPKEYEQINITGTKNIVQACLSHNIKKLVHVSTANTVGPGNKHHPANELSAFRFVSANSPYINTKYIAQQYVLEQVIQKQLPAVIVNPTFMIGEYDSKPSSGQIILYGMHKRFLFFPPGGKNFVHIHDVSKGIVNALENGVNGECYLMAGENLSYKDFFKLLADVSGQKPILIPIPTIVLKIGGLAGSLMGAIRKTTLKLNYSSGSMLCLHNYYSGKKSEKELQVKYTPVKTAIENALTWFKENKYC